MLEGDFVFNPFKFFFNPSTSMGQCQLPGRIFAFWCSICFEKTVPGAAYSLCSVRVQGQRALSLYGYVWKLSTPSETPPKRGQS